MTRSIPSWLLCLLISIALLPYGDSKFAQHPSSSLRTGSSSNDQDDFLAHRKRGFVPSEDIDQKHVQFLPHIISLTNTTNSTDSNATAPTTSPTPATPAAPSSPTPKPTHQPTKHYEPPEDEEKEEEEKKHARIGVIFAWIVFAFALIWTVCYFRDQIFFFFGSAWNNTRRYGCKGCLSSFFPCILGSHSRGGGEPLDQIIFESEDPNEPLMMT